MSSLAGQNFAGYEILAKLGQGGMGAVYKARQPLLNRIVALKVMAEQISSDPDYVARFIREAASAANLRHPNIVEVFTAGEQNGMYFMAMEFVEGESLRKRLDRLGRIPPQEAVAITIYVAQALQHAWNKTKLIHRDIKPDNIFLSTVGEVKVGDLGLAKNVGTETTELTQSGVTMGSPHYISPEQAQAAKDIDFRTDIYSLGCTLYHMLTGKTPYAGDSSMVVIMKHVHEPAPAIFKTWPQCPMPLGMLVGRMLAKDRNARPKSYEQLVADLFAVSEKLAAISSQPSAVSAQPTVVEKAAASALAPATSPDAPTVALQPSAKPKKPVAIYAAAGVATLLALGGLFLWSPWRSGAPGDDAFVHEVAALPVEKQVERVVAKLKELNPGYNGDVSPRFENGVVDKLNMDSQGLTDISPLRALRGMTKLNCHRPQGEKSPLRDLSPLKGMQLTELNCSGASVSDLSPLGGMPLTLLNLNSTQVSDLSPLKGMTTLVHLQLMFTRVTDLSPLAGLRLKHLNCRYSKITDYSALRGMPLESLDCDKTALSIPANRTVLRPISTLQKINDLPVAEFWKQVDAAGTKPEQGVWKDAINLLPLIDPQKDAVTGTWVVRNGEVVSDDTKGAHLEIPYEPPGEYDFRVEFTRAGDTIQTLTHGGRTFQWAMGVSGGPLFGFQEINKKRLTDDNPTLLRLPQEKQLKEGRRYISTVEVRNDVVRAFIDGKKLAEWRTDYRDMGPHYLYRSRNSASLGVGSYGNATVFHRIEVREVTGKGTFTRSAAALPNTPSLQHSNSSAALSTFCAEVAALPAEQQITRVLQKLKELNPQFDPTTAKVRRKIEGGAVTELAIQILGVTDISPLRALTSLQRLACEGTTDKRAPLADLNPLRAMALTRLYCWSTEVRDLSPLRGMQLHEFACARAPVSDLSPLEHMPLTFFACDYTSVANLSPLRGMALTYVDISHSKTTDIFPLRGAPLTRLIMDGTPVKDLSALETMPLVTLKCDFHPTRDTEILRSIKTLKTINDLPAAEFWKRVEATQTADEAFVREVAALPAEQQVVRVIAKLKELNPGYDGMKTHKIRDGEVIELELWTEHISDISPVRALPSLQNFYCTGPTDQKFRPTGKKGMLADLSPLRGMHLTRFKCRYNHIADLSPLAGMAINYLESECNGTVCDLSPLEHMPLTWLRFDEHLLQQGRNREVLRNIKTLQKINVIPAADFWKKVDAGKTPSASSAADNTFIREVAALPAEQQVARVVAKLKELNPGFDRAVANEQHRIENGAVTLLSLQSFGLRDISPLQALPKLLELSLTGSSTSTGSVKDKGALQDLSPLAGMKIEKLSIWANQISDLSPLRGMPLRELHCGFNSELSDLTPLSGMPIGRLTCSGTKVSDLSPLKNTNLATIMIEHTPVTSLAPIANLKLLGINMRWTPVQDLSPLRNMPLGYILCDEKTAMEPANRAVLHSIRSLDKINNMPAAEFWKKADASETRKP